MDTTNLQSVCILGRQPALGLAELESLYGARELSLVSPQVAGLRLSTDQVDFQRLGGSTRLASVIAEVPSNMWKDVEKQLSNVILQLAAEMPEGKLQLGLSAFGIPVTHQKLVASGLTLKKIIRSKSGRSVRLVPNQEVELNAAQVIHNHLTGQTGVEMLVISTDHGTTLLARTVAIQDITSYTERDRGRPKRDARVGMLPPKLAQIIVNLTTTSTPPETSSCVLDPFCGTGVILQEAILMGFGAYGTDLEPRMVAYSQENLAWLASGSQKTGLESQVEAGDATSYSWSPAPTFVASETYLGRPFTAQPTEALIAQTSTEVNLILKKFLKNIHGQLATGTRLCLAVPAWQIRSHEFRHLPLVDQLDDLGYNRISFEHIRDDQLLYYREDQFTARQVLVLTRK